MPTAKATKASDKAQICRKLVVALQKMYGKSLPRIDLPVLETFLFAICLEDDGWETADTSYKKMLASYFDLNEIRVSSVNELEQVLFPLTDADWKGLRIRSMLRYVFESSYSFELEKFRRLTQEAAVKTLKKVNDLTPFVRDFALQHLLGSHIVCLDSSMLKAAVWFGLVPQGLDAMAAGEFLKGGLKKSEVAEFCHLLRCVATDPKFRDRFNEESDVDPDSVDIPSRLAELLAPPKKKPAKAPEKTSSPANSRNEKSTTKASVSETSAKSSAAPAAARHKDKNDKKKTERPGSPKNTPSAGTGSGAKPQTRVAAEKLSGGKKIDSSSASSAAAGKKRTTGNPKQENRGAKRK